VKVTREKTENCQAFLTIEMEPTELEESMEKVVFSLKVGQLSSVIKTPYGFHIFEVLERRPEGERSLPEAMPEIESKLFQSKRDEVYKDWLQDLRRKIAVEVNYNLINQLEFS